MSEEVVLLNVPLLAISLREVVQHLVKLYPGCKVDEGGTGEIRCGGVVLAVDGHTAACLIDRGVVTMSSTQGGEQHHILLVAPSQEQSEKSSPQLYTRHINGYDHLDQTIVMQQQYLLSVITGHRPPPAYEDAHHDPVLPDDFSDSMQTLDIREIGVSSKRSQLVSHLQQITAPGVAGVAADIEDGPCDVFAIHVDSESGEELDLRCLVQFFSDQRASGGGMLNKTLCYTQRCGRRAVITGRDSSVVARVLSGERTLRVGQHKVTMTACKAQPAPKPDPRCIILSNIPTDTPDETIVLLCKSHAHLTDSQPSPLISFRGDRGAGEMILVQFLQDEIEVEGVIAAVNGQTFCGARLSARKLYYTSCMEVDGLGDIHPDELRMLIESRVGRQKVVDVEMIENNNSALIYFKSYSVVGRALSGGPLLYRNRQLRLYPYLAQLCLALGRVPHLPADGLAPFLLSVDPILGQCVSSHQPYLEELNQLLLTRWHTTLVVQRCDDLPEWPEMEAHFTGGATELTFDQWQEGVSAEVQCYVEQFNLTKLPCSPIVWAAVRQRLDHDALDWFSVLEEDDAIVLMFCGKDVDVSRHINQVEQLIETYPAKSVSPVVSRPPAPHPTVRAQSAFPIGASTAPLAPPKFRSCRRPGHHDSLSGVETVFELYTTENIHVSLCLGDVVLERSDAIVCSSNRTLKHDMGIAQCIADAAGPDYMDQVKKLIKKHKKIEETKCVHTSGGRLSGPRYVIHAVGPMRKRDKDDKWCHLLENTIVNALVYANKELEIKSLSLPLLGAGAHGLAIETVSRIMYDAIVRYSKSIPPGKRHLVEIRIIDKSPEKLTNLRRVFRLKSAAETHTSRLVFSEDDVS